jgi:hypothetical protein
MILLAAVLCISASSYAQKVTEKLTMYITMNDFLTDNRSEAAIVLHSSDDSYLVTRGFSDSQTGKRLKGIGAPWSLKRGDSHYFNMLYCDDLMSGIYVRLDVVGRYCLAVLDKETYGKVKSNSINSYGYGALGLLANNSSSWNKSLKDSTESKMYIVIIDTHDIVPRDSPKHEGSRGYLLGKKKVAELMKSNNMEGSARDLTFEEVLALVKTENVKWK